MPYVKTENREDLETLIRYLNGVGKPATEGDLNFLITELLVGSLVLDTEPKYDKINAAIGVLECVKL